MKKIIRLKGELLLAIVIAIVFGMAISLVGTSIYRKIILNEEGLEKLALERNNEDVEYIRKQLDIDSNDKDIVCENLREMERNLGHAFIDRIYIVDKAGKVEESTGKIPIKQFDIIIEEGTKVTVRNNEFSAITIMKINDENYVVFLNEDYAFNDMPTIYIWSISSVIIFLLLIIGRVSYITSISKSVNRIAIGELSTRVPLKYNDELRELAENINNMVEQLQNQEEEEKEFITNIAHDLRTPLTTILGYSKMIEDKVYENEEELQRYVSIINRKGTYLRTMLEDFFQYSKLHSKDLPMEKTEINLNQMILQLIDCEEVAFVERGLEVEVNLENKQLLILGDPVLIARAFSNLISNSLKYSKENSTVKISVKEKVINNVKYGVFTIKNTPKEEVDEKEIDKFFKRLYKKDKGRNEDGSGLGLAITKEIVKQHYGFLECKLKGKNLEFIIGIKLLKST